MLLATNPFNISPTTYIRRIMKRWFNRYLYLLTAAIVLLAALGFICNPAFFIVALMTVFIIIPTAMMFVYYFYALNPRIAMLSSGATTISLNHDHISFDISREECPPFQFQIPLSQVKTITPGDTLDTIIYGNTLDGIILIDKNAFPSPQQRIQFHNYIFDYNQPKHS